MYKCNKDRRGILSKAKNAYEQKGLTHLIYSGIHLILNYALREKYNIIHCEILKHRRPRGTFTFEDKTYHYFYHPYNTTWKNERAVEVPIILEKIRSCKEGKVLEVGNVLSHYIPFKHDIVDKYENADGVLNQDIADYQPAQKYDLIVCISTIEHVGWDEMPRNPKKILIALENLTRCIDLGGQIDVTYPIGYNRDLDKLKKEGKICFTEEYYLKRISDDNRWKQVEWYEVHDANYGKPYPCANAIFVGIIKQ